MRANFNILRREYGQYGQMSRRSEIYEYFCLFLGVDGIVLFGLIYINIRVSQCDRRQHKDIAISLLIYFCVTDLDLYETRMYRIWIRLLNDSMFM